MFKSITSLLTRKNLVYLSAEYRQLKRFERVLSNFSATRKVNVTHRFYSTNEAVGLPFYPQKENAFAYALLQPLTVTGTEIRFSEVKTMISNDNEFRSFLDKNWGKCSTEDIVKGFSDTLQYCKDNKITISNTHFDKLVDGLIDNIEKLTKEDIAVLLKVLCELPKPEGATAHNYHDMWSALDDLCCWRMREWDLQTCLQIAELWYKLGLGRICDFIFELLAKYSKKPERLSKAELVHIFFYFNVCRKRNMDFSYENAVDQKIRSMTVNEVGIVAMGFFKTKTRVKSLKTLLAMIDCVIDNSGTVHEITLAAIVKLVRMTQHPLASDRIMDLLHCVTPQIGRLSNLCCLHISLIGTGLQLFSAESLTVISEKLSKDLHNPKAVRLKDIERFLLALTMFDFNPKISNGDMYNLLLKELYNPERDIEKESYPKCLPAALLFLSITDIYPQDLISEVLNMEFIQRVYGKRFANIPRELFTLNMSVEIERPDYKGHKIPRDLCRQSAKLLIEYLPDRSTNKRLTAADKLIHDVLDTCRNIVGNTENVFLGHILPHFTKADIVLCYDKVDKKFVKPPFEQYYIGDIVHPINLPRFKWFVVIPIAVNTTIRYMNKPVGMVNKKHRQLTKLGYTPILVPYHEYILLNEDHKINYICTKINKSLKQ